MTHKGLGSKFLHLLVYLSVCLSIYLYDITHTHISYKLYGIYTACHFNMSLRYFITLIFISNIWGIILILLTVTIKYNVKV